MNINFNNFSKYTKVLDFDNCSCFFNSLSLDKIYVLKTDNIDHKRLKAVLKRNNFLSDFDSRAERFIRQKKSSFVPEFKQLYIVISEACNFNCQYCRQTTHGLRRDNLMDKSNARDVINVFFKLAKSEPRGVVFYGGEPLLNNEVLVDSINYIRKKEKDLKLKEPIDLTIITNGTNIDIKTAKILKKNDVYIIISLDGRKKEHNRLRVFKDGKGTFDEVLKGYNIYKSSGCKVGISCTIGSHNYNSLPSIFNYFAKKLKPVNVGINLPHDDYNNPLNFNLNFVSFCKNIFEIFEKSLKNDLYIEHIMRKLNLLFRQKIKVNDCPACGGRLVSLPGGRLGVCEGAIGMDNYFFKKIDAVIKMSSDWYLTAPLFNKQCSHCLALGLCGGGCPFDGYLQKKDIKHKDKRKCIFVKMIIEWGLYNFYLKNKDRIIKEAIFIPKKSDQIDFLESIKATKNKLPLRSSAIFSDVKIKKI